jgi:hypothetical protein
MKALRKIVAAFLLSVTLAAVSADLLSSHDYATQFRLEPNAPPSRRFPLGTDEPRGTFQNRPVGITSKPAS